ncbi:MAG: TRAP transporter small permease subunit [Proteobacteria bacterium]|jgi:TRAP-type C4-dicarboxylate transport system permease small subunit|nr:TRAP transporter small permease subunit [Pseudomonadota bacterium]MDA1238905.1 TRAP transporter small permease subunit [Pseudomonadota bacterium]
MLKVVNILSEKAANLVAGLGALILLWMVGLTCVDVLGRYIFNSPVIGGTELVQLSMGAIIFLSLPWVFLKNDQIIVDLFKIVAKGWFGWIMAVVFSSIIVFVTYIVGNKTWLYAVRAYEDKDVTIYLSIPRMLDVGLITGSIYFCGFLTCIRVVNLLTSPGKIGLEDVAEFKLEG